MTSSVIEVALKAKNDIPIPFPVFVFSFPRNLFRGCKMYVIFFCYIFSYIHTHVISTHVFFTGKFRLFSNCTLASVLQLKQAPTFLCNKLPVLFNCMMKIILNTFNMKKDTSLLVILQNMQVEIIFQRAI